MNKSRVFNKCDLMTLTAEMINNIDHQNFATLLAQHLKSIIKCDSLVMMLYAQSSIPYVVHNEVKEINTNVFQDIYLQGAYLLSPLYLQHRKNCFGFYDVKELVPDGFYQGEYYLGYYSKSGLTDQVVFLINLGNGRTLAISLGLLTGNYSQSDKNTLSELDVVITAVVKKHWQKNQPASQTLQHRLQNAFDQFASSVLSTRERDVIQKLMQGHSSKSAAKALNLSVDTERSYRKSAYAKLDIGSQSELFNLLFSCLRYADQCKDQDPLLFLGGTSQ